MRNTERERNGLRAFIKGPRAERPSTVIFGQGISCVIVYQHSFVCIALFLLCLFEAESNVFFNQELDDIFNSEGSICYYMLGSILIQCPGITFHV